MPYIPLHDRLPDPPSPSRGHGPPTPRYAEPDIDPDQSLTSSGPGRMSTHNASASGLDAIPSSTSGSSRRVYQPRKSLDQDSDSSSRKRLRSEEEARGSQKDDYLSGHNGSQYRADENEGNEAPAARDGALGSGSSAFKPRQSADNSSNGSASKRHRSTQDGNGEYGETSLSSISTQDRFSSRNHSEASRTGSSGASSAGYQPRQSASRVSEVAYGNEVEAEGGEEENNGYEAEAHYAPSTSADTYPYGQVEHLAPPHHVRLPPKHIYPSFFNTSARNPVSRVVGEFIMNHCRGRRDVEVEIKLGIITQPPQQGQRGRRVNFPACTELVLPLDFRVGPFKSDMTKAQHIALNSLLNMTLQQSDPRHFVPDPSNPSVLPPYPIRYSRIKQRDDFYPLPGNSKVRVSTSLANESKGQLLACIEKQKIADMNVSVPGERLDFRVSVNTEAPRELPNGNASLVREKDRLCYTHQLVQIDLTYVVQHGSANSAPTYEVEIEVRDVPSLIAEGEKEERDEPNRFDEMITSILDTTRILIRNLQV